jgi:arylsulfatase A-like enzyme
VTGQSQDDQKTRGGRANRQQEIPEQQDQQRRREADRDGVEGFVGRWVSKAKGASNAEPDARQDEGDKRDGSPDDSEVEEFRQHEGVGIWNTMRDESSVISTTPARPRSHFGALLIVAAATGLAGGLFEALVTAIRQFGLGEFMVINRHFPWMTAVAALAVSLLAAVAVWPLTWFRWRRLGERAAMLLLVGVAAAAPLGAAPYLATYAEVLIAAGLAVQVVRAYGDLDRLARRLLPVMRVLGLIVVLLATFMLGWAWWEERRAMQALGAPPDAPNVAVIVLDTVRASNLTVYGYARDTTPGLARIAAQGTVFDEAISPSPWTLPAHASLFTGLYPRQHRADWSKPLDAQSPTLAEVLSARGYATGAFSANTLNVTRTHGLHRGFVRFDDLPLSFGQFCLSSSLARRVVSNGSLRHLLKYHEVIDRRPATTITDAGLEWLDELPDGRPFFLFLNYFDAHDPYLPPDPFATKFGPRRPSNAGFWHTGVAAWPVDRRRMRPLRRQNEIDAYDGAIAYVDAEIARLTAELERRGQLDRTLLVITSDHGEQLGEHGLFNHGNSLYRPLLHVPLILRLPGAVPAGRRVASRVSLTDVPATILDLLFGSPTSLPGETMRTLLADRDDRSDPAFAEASRRPFGEDWYPLVNTDMKSVFFDRYEFIQRADGPEELFDLTQDPGETRNLVELEEHRGARDAARELIRRGPRATPGAAR